MVPAADVAVTTSASHTVASISRLIASSCGVSRFHRPESATDDEHGKYVTLALISSKVCTTAVRPVNEYRSMISNVWVSGEYPAEYRSRFRCWRVHGCHLHCSEIPTSAGRIQARSRMRAPATDGQVAPSSRRTFSMRQISPRGFCSLHACCKCTALILGD